MLKSCDICSTPAGSATISIAGGRAPRSRWVMTGLPLVGLAGCCERSLGSGGSEVALAMVASSSMSPSGLEGRLLGAMECGDASGSVLVPSSV